MRHILANAHVMFIAGKTAIELIVVKPDFRSRLFEVDGVKFFLIQEQCIVKLPELPRRTSSAGSGGIIHQRQIKPTKSQYKPAG